MLSDAWRDVRRSGEAAEFENELDSELPNGHPLSGVKRRVIAVRRLNKETVWHLPRVGQWAVVHLTWHAEASPPFPSTTIHQAWRDVIAELADRGCA